mmetsp:Transcript_2572/g.4492  ORF Transcript_2572/g.4492 Transcript_2572/m.4492 type:complete len:705 (-) Transcript_2572:7-2121(-)
MPAALKYVATTSAVSRQRSRSGEVPVIAFHTLAVSPGMSRQRSRSGELPVTSVTALTYVAPPQVALPMARSREASRSSQVSMTALKYVAASPTISRQSSPSGLLNVISVAKTSPDLSRERSRSVEVPLQVISPPRTLPQVVLGSIQDKVENGQVVSVGKAAGDGESNGKENERKRATMQYACSLQRSAYLNAAEDGPKIEVHRKRKEEARSASKKRFLDASSWVSSTVDATTTAGKTDVQDSSSQEGADSSVERAVGVVKLRWQAGRFSVVNRQAADECPENQSVRYYDGLLEVEDFDLPHLRALLASARAVGIGDQPGTGLTGAAVTPRPEFFHSTATALEGTDGKTFCFPVLIRHPGCSRDTSAERHEERVKVEKVQVDEANAKARAAELKAFQMGLGCLAIHKRANVAEKERDEEKARAEAVKKEEEEAMAKARAAEQKAIEAEKERNAVHQRAMVIERELDTEKAKVETAEAEVAEAHARLRAAELKAFQMGLGCLADHKRANAAEKERDEEKAKAEAAQTKLEEAMAKAQAAEVKAAEAEAERDAARQRAIAAEIERDAEKARGQRAIEESHLAKVRSLASEKWCDEERWSIQTASTTGSSAELFDTSNSGTTLAELDSPDSREAFCFSARSEECGESASGTAHTQGGSKPKAVEFPAHLHDEAAFAHAYLPVDAYVSLVLSELPQSKQVENSRQQLSA